MTTLTTRKIQVRFRMSPYSQLKDDKLLFDKLSACIKMFFTRTEHLTSSLGLEGGRVAQHNDI
jgi:hypothetical protein